MTIFLIHLWGGNRLRIISQASGLLPKSAIRSTLAAALSGGGGTSGMKALQLRDLVDACLEW